MPNISTFKSPAEMTHHNITIQTWARLGKLKIYAILKNKKIMKRGFFIIIIIIIKGVHSK